MKKIKKESLKLEKEVITSLSDESLAFIMGGGGPDTFYSNCLCVSKENKTCNDTTVIDYPISTGVPNCKPLSNVLTVCCKPESDICQIESGAQNGCIIQSYVVGKCNV